MWWFSIWVRKKKNFKDIRVWHIAVEKETLLPVNHHNFLWTGYCVLYNTLLFSVFMISHNFVCLLPDCFPTFAYLSFSLFFLFLYPLIFLYFFNSPLSCYFFSFKVIFIRVFTLFCWCFFSHSCPIFLSVDKMFSL